MQLDDIQAWLAVAAMVFTGLGTIAAQALTWLQTRRTGKKVDAVGGQLNGHTEALVAAGRVAGLVQGRSEALVKSEAITARAAEAVETARILVADATTTFRALTASRLGSIESRIGGIERDLARIAAVLQVTPALDPRLPAPVPGPASPSPSEEDRSNPWRPARADTHTPDPTPPTGPAPADRRDPPQNWK